jgi:hypothetical protein
MPNLPFGEIWNDADFVVHENQANNDNDAPQHNIAAQNQGHLHLLLLLIMMFQLSTRLHRAHLFMGMHPTFSLPLKLWNLSMTCIAHA